jgi:hypothetical protein
MTQTAQTEEKTYVATHISAGRLKKEFDWTPGAIEKFLGEPDRIKTIPNPYGRGSINVPMYSLEKVAAVAQDAAYQAWRNKRAASIEKRAISSANRKASTAARHEKKWGSLNRLVARIEQQNEPINPGIVSEYFAESSKLDPANMDYHRVALINKIKNEIMADLVATAQAAGWAFGAVESNITPGKPYWRDMVIDSPIGQVRWPIYVDRYYMATYAGALNEHPGPSLIQLYAFICDERQRQAHRRNLENEILKKLQEVSA